MVHYQNMIKRTALLDALKAALIPFLENSFIFERVKASGFDDRKRTHIRNMGQFTIVKSRGFHAAEI